MLSQCKILHECNFFPSFLIRKRKNEISGICLNMKFKEVYSLALFYLGLCDDGKMVRMIE